MPEIHAGPNVTCPVCSQPTTCDAFRRPSRDATWDRLTEGIVPSWGIFVPGPFADVHFADGHSLHGDAGAKWLDAQTAKTEEPR